MLYELNFYTNPGEIYREKFFIGLFFTREEAENTKKYYRTSVAGFHEYPCEAEIKEITVIGDGEYSEVFHFTGWNEDENGNEIDIFYSDYYVSKMQAQTLYKKTQKTIHRTEWAFNRTPIGKHYWEEGFFRYDPKTYEITK
jgi:hypothetical protein